MQAMKSWTDRREEDMVLSELGTITGLQIGIVRGGGKSRRSRGPRDLRVKALVFTSQNLLDPCSPMVRPFTFTSYHGIEVEDCPSRA
jgi:hypothetical protein